MTGPSENRPLTDADLRASGYEAVLQLDSEASYSTLWTLFGNAAEAASEQGEVRREAVFVLLGRLSSMLLVPEDKAVPYHPGIVMDGKRSPIPQDFTADEIEAFVQFADAVTHPLLKARLADLVWMRERQRGIRFCQMAIEAYRAAPLDAETWHLSGRQCWHRALQLALSISSATALPAMEIQEALLGAFWKAAISDGYDPLWYLTPLYANLRKGDAPMRAAGKIAAQLEEIGQAREKAQRAGEARAFYDEAARWLGAAGKTERQAQITASSARCWEAQGDSQESGIASRHCYANAIKAYRDVPTQYRPALGVDAAIDGARAKLAAAGEQAVSEMQTLTAPPVDVTEWVAYAKDSVTGLAPLSALAAFIELYEGPNLKEYRDDATAALGGSIVAQIFGGVVLSDKGRAVAKHDPMSAGPAAEEIQVRAHMVRDFAVTAAHVALGMIAPALEAMQFENYLSPDDFRQLAEHSPLVPRERIDIVAKGLHAGYCRDYVQAMHILMPQFEHMVRMALKGTGTHTTTHKDEVDMETGLSTLVERPQMITVFGEDLTFEISAIMCEQGGPNLRNQIAHGLSSSELCEGSHGVYAWWLVLRLVVQAYLALHHARSIDAAQVAANADPR